VLFFIFSYTFVINTLEELYTTINVLTEAFSKYYWDTEKVNRWCNAAWTNIV